MGRLEDFAYDIAFAEASGTSSSPRGLTSAEVDGIARKWGGRLRRLIDDLSRRGEYCDCDDLAMSLACNDSDNPYHCLNCAKDLEPGRWISVGERLPEPGEETPFLVAFVGLSGWLPDRVSDRVFIAYLDAGEEWREVQTEVEISDLTGGGEVTHWMPLPLPPNQL